MNIVRDIAPLVYVSLCGSEIAPCCVGPGGDEQRGGGGLIMTQAVCGL